MVVIAAVMRASHTLNLESVLVVVLFLVIMFLLLDLVIDDVPLLAARLHPPSASSRGAVARAMSARTTTEYTEVAPKRTRGSAPGPAQPMTQP
jgi:hypothetical protein